MKFFKIISCSLTICAFFMSSVSTIKAAEELSEEELRAAVLNELGRSTTILAESAENDRRHHAQMRDMRAERASLIQNTRRDVLAAGLQNEQALLDQTRETLGNLIRTRDEMHSYQNQQAEENDDQNRDELKVLRYGCWYAGKRGITYAVWGLLGYGIVVAANYCGGNDPTGFLQYKHPLSAATCGLGGAVLPVSALAGFGYGVYTGWNEGVELALREAAGREIVPTD